MKPTFRSLFIQIQITEVPSGLCNSVIQHIVAYERKVAKRKCIAQGVLSAASLVGGVVIFNAVVQSFAQSGFYQYFQLIFSGDSEVLTYWKELSMSLVESVPLVGTIVFLAVFGIFIWSAGNTAKNARVLMHPTIA